MCVFGTCAVKGETLVYSKTVTKYFSIGNRNGDVVETLFYIKSAETRSLENGLFPRFLIRP